MMSCYSEIDPVIAKWVLALGVPLHEGSADSHLRCFYIPGEPPFESFQICINPPCKGSIKVLASSVGTKDGTEDGLEASWEGAVSQLEEMLASAVETVVKWKKRKPKRPDPPSPW